MFKRLTGSVAVTDGKFTRTYSLEAPTPWGAVLGRNFAFKNIKKHVDFVCERVSIADSASYSYGKALRMLRANNRASR